MQDVNTVTWSKKAQKQLLKLSAQEALVIYDRVDDLKNFPDCQNVKRLITHRYGYRLRVGRYRVLFDHDSEIKVISIEEVKKRDERTY